VVRDDIERIVRAIESTKATINTLRSRSIIEAEVTDLDSQISTIDDRLAEIEKELADTEQVLIDKAKIIGTTVHKTFLDSRLLKKQWDVVLVDEVSMLLLPMTYFAAGKAKKRVILVGDFQQLPPIVCSDSDNVLKWIKADPFVKWKVDQSKVRKESRPPVFVALREQGRMHEEICDLVSQSFYEPKWLTTASYVNNRKDSPPSLGKTTKRILFVNTSTLGGWSSKRYGKGSLFNVTHAALVGGIVEELRKKGHSDCIGIVTPYAAQRELIATLLGGSLPEDAVGTAHKFQGGEKDTIIIDLVEASSKPSRFINAQAKNDDAGRLLNVALSRAKEYLIVVASKRVFDRSGSKFMQQLLNRIERVSEVVDPVTLFPNSKYLATASEWAMGRKIIVDAKHVLFTEQGFYPAVTGDLSMAKKSVVIFSAFMTTTGVTRWLAVLHKVLSQGVKVRIVTKTLDKQPGAKRGDSHVVREELSHLVGIIRRAGVVVDLRSETHEKIVVVDERIVWNGSLNMLSQVKDATREHMTRTDDEIYASEILSLLSRHDLRASRNIDSEHPVCPQCNGRTYLDTGFQGVIKLRCEDGCGWSVRQDLFRLLVNGVPVGKRIKDCSNEGCNGHLILRNSSGRYFLGCTNYPSCRHKEDVSVAQFRYNPFPEEVIGTPDGLSSYGRPDWSELSGGNMIPAPPTSKEDMPPERPIAEVDFVDKQKSKAAVDRQPKGRKAKHHSVPSKKPTITVAPRKSGSTKKSTDDFISKLGDKLFG
jgi:ssDNA-binding Zn-finger/Zn-ribbon topoisomerase 1